MRYLILGSSGQVGAALTEYLRSQKEEVIEYDLVRSSKEDLRLYPNPLLESLVHSADFVFFLAFDVGGSLYLKTYQNSFEFLSNNAKIMEFTFQTLKKFAKPFIFASSQMANMLHSPYGLLKALGDQYTRTLGGLIIKFWNVYGIEKDLAKSHVITDFILKARQNGRIDMLTNGEEERQFLFADDACRALTVLAQNYGSIPRDVPLHITSFAWTSIKVVAAMIAKHFPETTITAAKEKDTIQLSQRNEPDPSIQKWWQPSVTIEEGIEKMVAYYTQEIEVHG